MRGLRFFALVLVASIGLLTARPAHAAILLEPYLGYEFGKLKYSGTPSADFDVTSAALGARLGYAFPVVFIAADYSTLLGGSAKDSAGNKADATGSQLFAEVGAHLPLIRGYLGYGLMNTLELSSNGTSTKFENGTAIKAGIGTTILPMVAINLEYITSTYDKVGGITTSNYKSDLFMLNVSLPFEF
jgi:hypothetical protein